MRDLASSSSIATLLEQLGRRSRGPGRVYLVGGATALLEGWRSTTVDIDLKIDPEPLGIFEAIAELKDELRLNIELASPDQFIPPQPDWREFSPFLVRHGEVDFHHYDLRGQALAKLARFHDRDLADVGAMLTRGLVGRAQLLEAFERIRPNLVRYPALDAVAFEARVRRFLEVEP